MDSHPALSFLRAIPLFAHVEASDAAEVLELLRAVRLEPGETLFREGEPGHAMWVLGGSSEVEVLAPTAGAPPLALLLAGQTLGEMALLDDGPRSATARVVRGGPAWRIEAIHFARLREQGSPLAVRMLRRLAEELCARLRMVALRQATPLDQASASPTVLGAGASPSEAELRAFPAFAGLGSTAAFALSRRMQLHTLPAGTVLFEEGEAGTGLFFVLEGRIAVGPVGTPVQLLGPGAVLGLLSAIDRGPRAARCALQSDARLLQLDREAFESMFTAGHRVARRLVECVALQLCADLRAGNASLHARPPAGAHAGLALGTREVSVDVDLGELG